MEHKNIEETKFIKAQLIASINSIWDKFNADNENCCVTHEYDGFANKVETLTNFLIETFDLNNFEK